MPTEEQLPLAERLLRLLQHLGVPRAHVAASWAQDYLGLLGAHPEVVASLILVCPRMDLDVGALAPVAPRLLLIHGDCGPQASVVPDVLPHLRGAAHVTLSGYADAVWADAIADRSDQVGRAMLDFLAGMDHAQPMPPLCLPTGVGEVAGLAYRVCGSGPPLLLLPLGFAASQWDALEARLAERYCTIVLGGRHVGPVAILEERGCAAGYQRMFRSVIDEVQLRPGEAILDVGCGTGVLDRWLARHTADANRIVAVDANGYLLREAKAFARQEGLAERITFHEGRAEALPFPDASFDVALSVTVLEEGDAERMLAELLRVARPGGRVAAIVRAVDMPGWINLPLRRDLKVKAEFPFPGAGVAAGGCADASLYRRFCAAGLSRVSMWPYLAAFEDGPRARIIERGMRTRLAGTELEEWAQATAHAEADGTFFVCQPFHCAVGTKR
ncbi:MAG: methyltransferase domain-containing protein [Chloroflexi bacterium]|nr:methyltransferase domain-containing protein [Chloroflexota bacterium]